MTPFAVLTGLGAGLGLWQVYRQARPQHARPLLDAASLALMLALLGGRAGYVALHPDYFSAHAWEALALWQGGYAWPGALLGGLLAVPVAALFGRRSLAQVADGLTPLLAPLAAGIWLGCWPAGAGYGPPVPDGAWWGIPAPDEAGLVLTRLPLQPLAALLLLAWLWLSEAQTAASPRRIMIPGRRAALALLGLGLDILLASLLWAAPTLTLAGLRIDTWAAAAVAASGLLGWGLSRKRGARNAE